MKGRARRGKERLCRRWWSVLRVRRGWGCVVVVWVGGVGGAEGRKRAGRVGRVDYVFFFFSVFLVNGFL